MIGYTNIDNVLLEAGLKHNNNIDIGLVKSQIDGAEGIVNGVIGNIYNLPLSYRAQNYIEFKDTATAGGTITITINGTEYEVTVSSGDSSADIANAFRYIARNATTIKVDDAYDRAGSNKVYFVAIDLDDEDAVSVDSIDMGTVAGTTATEASIISRRYPMIVEIITRKLAAALLLDTSFGKSANGSSNDAESKIENAYSLLDKINNKEIKVMDDLGGEELTHTTDALPLYSPTETSTALDTTEEGATPRNFEYRNQF